MAYPRALDFRWLLYAAIYRIRRDRRPETNRYYALILLAVLEYVWLQLALSALGAPNLIADRIGHSKASDLAVMLLLSLLNGTVFFAKRGCRVYFDWRESQPSSWLALEVYVGWGALLLTVMAAWATIGATR